MAVRINNLVCSWQRFTDPKGSFAISVRGNAFSDEKYWGEGEFANRIAIHAGAASADKRFETVKQLAKKLNGSWAFIVEYADGETIAAVDRLRSIPLFYARCDENSLLIANNITDLSDCPGANELDEEAAIEFMLSGYVMDSRTLMPGVSQLQPGEILHWKDGSLSLSRYYRFLRTGWSSAGSEKLMDELAEVMDHVFSRYVRHYSDRKIYVPLSGGLDSRLILAMLIRHGHKDIVAFNYGRPGYIETETSRAVAESLNVPWIGMNYAEGNWHQLMKTERMRDFWRYAGQNASLPHIQDYPALENLRRDDPRLEAVFFSGVAGDMIAGAWVPDHYTNNQGSLDLEAVAGWIYYRKYALWPSKRRHCRKVMNRIRRFFAEAPFSDVHNSAAAFDLFEFENRQAKYIVNSVRSVEFHGYDWQIPLCANELMDFYLTVPTEQRELKRLCAIWTRDRLFTGSMARLAEITPMGTGERVWHGKSRPIRHGFGPRVVRASQKMLKHFILPRIHRWKLAAPIIERTLEPLRFSEWFVGSELNAKTLTLGDLLAEDDGVFRDMPSVATAFSTRFHNYPVFLARPLGLLALAYLAEMNRTQL